MGDQKIEREHGKGEKRGLQQVRGDSATDMCCQILTNRRKSRGPTDGGGALYGS